MQSFAREVITRAALSAGMPEGSVIDIVKKDNLTIRRPRPPSRMSLLPWKNRFPYTMWNSST